MVANRNPKETNNYA